MNLKYLLNGLRDQLPLRRLIKNLKTGDVFGLFHRRSHETAGGNPKVGYNTKKTATRVAKEMGEKYDAHFANYRCIFCGKYHIGKNRSAN